MTAPRRNQRSRRRPRPKGDKVQDLWREVPTPEDPEAITPAAEPTALLDSLGSPPLRGQSSAAEHYLASVVERAAAVATALAASADVLAPPEQD
jgi:hypothetical protein